MSELYEMELHENRSFENKNGRFEVVRVPGGWLYFFVNRPCVFVPFDNEFQQ